MKTNAIKLKQDTEFELYLEFYKDLHHWKSEDTVGLLLDASELF